MHGILFFLSLSLSFSLIHWQLERRIVSNKTFEICTLSLEFGNYNYMRLLVRLNSNIDVKMLRKNRSQLMFFVCFVFVCVFGGGWGRE